MRLRGHASSGESRLDSAAASRGKHPGANARPNKPAAGWGCDQPSHPTIAAAGLRCPREAARDLRLLPVVHDVPLSDDAHCGKEVITPPVEVGVFVSILRFDPDPEPMEDP